MEVTARIVPREIYDLPMGEVKAFWRAYFFGNEHVCLSPSTVHWMKQSQTLFYAWHWYGQPKDPKRGVSNALAVSKDWNMPSFLTEFYDCVAWDAAAEAGISLAYWHYSSYCDDNESAFGPKQIPEETFGACILGWAGGMSTKCQSDEVLA